MNVAEKLQLKSGQSIAIVHEPPGVSLDLPRDVEPTPHPAAADAVLVFAGDRTQLAARANHIADAARRGALAWLAYPKAGQLGTDLDRDVVRDVMAEMGVTTVRQVAIDHVWSALRFRPA